MQLNYIIYKAENTENGYVYVGATTKSVEERKKDHECKAKNGTGYKFQEAISTYGVEAFTWEQIDTATNHNELAQKEKEYILEYNSKDKGYNLDNGGGIAKQVYQYNISTETLVYTYSSLSEAGEQFGIDKKSLSKVCLSVNKTFNNFYWSYDYKEPFEPLKDFRNKSVIQCNKNGKELKTFKSVSEASKKQK